jgi:ATP-dependent helicase/nuclease subunit A
MMAAMSPTSEQEAAVTTTGRALLVEAGAGTGKTWVLVQRFIHLLSRYPDWPLDSIVAITFTEKATREMRGRIRRAVAAMVTPQTPADSPWRRRLDELELLQISTIHGLCSRILRENAIDAGVDPFFEVLDEQEADLLKDEAVRQALAELVEQESPCLALLDTLRVWDLQGEMAVLLNQRGTVQHLFDELPGPAALLARWRAEIAAMGRRAWEHRIRQDAGLRETLSDLPLVPITDPADGLAGAVRLAQEGCRLLQTGDLLGAARCWLGIDLRGGRAANWADVAALKEMLKTLREAAKALESTGALEEIGPADEAAAVMLQLWRDLWRHLLATYDRLKEARQALDFDDLEWLAWKLLAQSPRPRRLADFVAGINHLMVDEFQDTNITQQRIVYSLAHPAEEGRLFVVGDAKQSIYRFRQAQVAVFNRTSHDIESLTGHPALPLSRSFRTHSSLVSALNDLFDRVLQPLGADHADYEARPGRLSAQRPAPPPSPIAPAPVEMILLPQVDAREQKVSAEDGRIWEAHQLARRLLDLYRGKFQVWDKEEQRYRAFRFSDAAILFRATTNLPLYEESFKQAGLPYLTVSGRGYYDRPEVRDLIALLSCLYAPGDDLNLAAVLRSPLFSLSDETLYSLRWHRADGSRAETPVAFAGALREPPPTAQPEEVTFARATLEALWGRVGRVDVWQLLRQAIDATGYEATLILADAGLGGTGRRYANVVKFLALARDRGKADLSDFLRRLQDLQAREAREGEAPAAAAEAAPDGTPGPGAVQLLSIHAAKGLEFPVTVVADLGRRSRGGFGSPRILHDPAYGLVCLSRDEDGDWLEPASYTWARWLDGQMEEAENRRLLYVACTRAADLLILSGRVGDSSAWLATLQSIWEVPAKGDPESLLDFDGYRLRVLRPLDRPEVQPVEEEVPEPGPAVTEMPALARSLAGALPPPPAAVTALTRHRDARDRLYRVAGIDPVERTKARATTRQVGNVVHRALAHWDCLSWPPAKIQDLLEDFARREGLAHPDERHDAVVRSLKMLRTLRGGKLYLDIKDARRRMTEVPFVAELHGRRVHGAMDLLYQIREGDWHLLEWKTESYRPNEHRRQLAVYALAAERILGQRPRAALCYLQDTELDCREIPYGELDRLAREALNPHRKP